MIRAVIFDSDGMLVHGPRFSEKYVADHDIAITLMNDFFAGPFQQCIVGKADLREELQKDWLEKWSWKGSADELLNYWFSVGDVRDEAVFASVPLLRQKNITCVVATNQEKYRTAHLTNTFGYGTVFDKVYSSAYIGSKKPEPAFFAHITEDLAKTYGVSDPGEVMFWDDDLDNVRGAGDCGFDARHFTDAASYTRVMSEAGIL